MADVRIVALDGQQLVETLFLVDDATGLLTLPTVTPVNPDHAASKGYVDAEVGVLVDPAQLAAAVAPLAPQSEIARLDSAVADKAGAADLAALSADVLHLAGGTLAGQVSQPLDPAQPEHLANRQYVDDAVAAAIAALSLPSNTVVQGGFTPTGTTEYPAPGSAGDAWVISGLSGAPYTFLAGPAVGMTAEDGDQLVWGAANGDWFLVNL